MATQERTLTDSQIRRLLEAQYERQPRATVSEVLPAIRAAAHWKTTHADTAYARAVAASIGRAVRTRIDDQAENHRVPLSEGAQRQIRRFWAEAEEAANNADWWTVRRRLRMVLDLDPTNRRAQALMAAADRAVAPTPAEAQPTDGATVTAPDRSIGSHFAAIPGGPGCRLSLRGPAPFVIIVTPGIAFWAGVMAAVVAILSLALIAMRLLAVGAWHGSEPSPSLPATSASSPDISRAKPDLSVGAAPDAGSVEIRSTPSAGLLVDGESAGKTPRLLTLSPGPHDLALRLATYQPWERRIVVEPGRQVTIPPVELVPRPASKLLTPTGKALGREPYTDDLIIRVADPTDEFSLDDNIQAIAYVAPETHGVRDLSVHYHWKLTRPGGTPPLDLSGEQQVPASWDQTFLRACIPARTADPQASALPVTLELFVDETRLETFTFHVIPGRETGQTHCSATVPLQPGQE